MVEFLIDNFYVGFGGHVYQQIVGFSMGTNCKKLRLTALLMLQNGLIILIFVWSLMRMVKGGSSVLGKGGGQKIEMTVHVMVPGLWPVDATPLALPRGGLEGVTPPQLEEKNKEDFRHNLVTHRSQIYWIELQSEGPWMPMDATPLCIFSVMHSYMWYIWNNIDLDYLCEDSLNAKKRQIKIYPEDR